MQLGARRFRARATNCERAWWSRDVLASGHCTRRWWRWGCERLSLNASPCMHTIALHHRNHYAALYLLATSTVYIAMWVCTADTLACPAGAAPREPVRRGPCTLRLPRRRLHPFRGAPLRYLSFKPSSSATPHRTLPSPLSLHWFALSPCLHALAQLDRMPTSDPKRDVNLTPTPNPHPRRSRSCWIACLQHTPPLQLHLNTLQNPRPPQTLPLRAPHITTTSQLM